MEESGAGGSSGAPLVPLRIAIPMENDARSPAPSPTGKRLDIHLHLPPKTLGLDIGRCKRKMEREGGRDISGEPLHRLRLALNMENDARCSAPSPTGKRLDIHLDLSPKTFGYGSGRC